MTPNDHAVEAPVLVYKITCLTTGKIYFGITSKTLEARWKGHIKESRANRFDTVLYRAIRKYGPKDFTISLVHEAATAHDAQMRERALIIQTGSLAPAGMNSSTGGESYAGRAVTAEVRAKISASKLGKKMSAQARANMSTARRGLRASPQKRAACRAAMARPDVKERAMVGLKRAREDGSWQKANAAALKARWQDPGFRARRAADLAALNARKKANKKPVVKGRGKHGAMIARWQDPEYRARMLTVLSRMRDTKRYGASTVGVRAMVRQLDCDIVLREAARGR